MVVSARVAYVHTVFLKRACRRTTSSRRPASGPFAAGLIGARVAQVLFHRKFSKSQGDHQGLGSLWCLNSRYECEPSLKLENRPLHHARTLRGSVSQWSLRRCRLFSFFKVHAQVGVLGGSFHLCGGQRATSNESGEVLPPGIQEQILRDLFEKEVSKTGKSYPAEKVALKTWIYDPSCTPSKNERLQEGLTPLASPALSRHAAFKDG